ncbi:acyltransferase [Novosphingobium sp. TH158]|uniref:acyltransferase family protein n=1 Tax=Novosphingobium sp. TH158 TaxID=2067455 RepID=UPI000C7E55DD|nr:acyltransferase [Novosphingobium sp. TH158]PLK24418.1 hypothetical protein C0V78_14300 [Novosphingobium sp. TH158]
MPDRIASGDAALRLDWLDYVRLFCALLVMLHHYLVLAPDPRIGHGITSFGAFTQYTQFASTALFSFLMISGMVVTLVAQRERASTFVANRFARIYPTFVLCMVLTAMLSPLGPPRFLDTWPQVLANLVFYAPAFGYRYVDTVYWTLVVELNFYLAIALLILTGAIHRLQIVVVVWLAGQSTAVLAGIDVALFGKHYHFFSAGMVMALLYQRRNERLNLFLLAVSYVLCLVTSRAYARALGFSELGSAVFIAAVFALFLVMRGRSPRLPFARRIGSLTYPLYLLHFSLGMTIFYWWITEANKWFLVIGTVALFLMISLAIDHVIEFRCKSLWKRLGMATIARPLVWWEGRRAATPDHARLP